MHIPDGYLSPQTAIPAIAAMVPIWAVSLKKVKKLINNRRIPLLALCAAFSFIIMMFNVPVVGGSSAHAVGAVLISIILGPWAGCICVSTALIIQAVVFGDGGILAIGANCLNMAVIMPFTGYYIFKFLRGKAETGSARGLVSAFTGSYLGLNLAALCAAIEFGIQPMFFRSASGVPLYGIYPLSVSFPSMLFAHSLIAGPIEGIITIAAVAYLTKAAPNVFVSDTLSPASNKSSGLLRGYRALFIPLIALIVLTPLGLIAQGTAFGEWGNSEIKNMAGFVPSGFAKFSQWWHALMPDYSVPAFGGSLTGSIAGYIISAVVGMLIIASLLTLSAKLSLKITKGRE